MSDNLWSFSGTQGNCQTLFGEFSQISNNLRNLLVYSKSDLLNNMCVHRSIHFVSYFRQSNSQQPWLMLKCEYTKLVLHYLYPKFN